MPDWSSLRRRARMQHRQLCARLGADPQTLPTAEELLHAAAEETGIDAFSLEPTNSLLSGAHAVLDRASDCIWYAEEEGVPPHRHRFARAHEYAHLWLHPEIETDLCHCEDVPDTFAAPVAGVPGAQVAEGYSSRERRETEANLFAAELLLPGPVLRELVAEKAWTASRIAAQSGLSLTCVLTQLASALLIPEPEEAPSPGGVIELDPDQQAAAYTEQGPLLVDAGPGAGKTRTLTTRLVWLLQERNVPPENILALTFSNLAAEEMRSRLALAVGDPADRVWISTFHSFGYELLRKEGGRIGLPATPRLLDVPDAVELLERNLDRLPLQEFEYLSRPALAFPDILRCISRAKDELVGPEAYLHLAERQLQQAGTDPDALRAARKSIEIARIYAVYQQLLDEHGLLDFGDLLMRSIELLTRQEEVRERWRARYPQIVADEYQDINRASSLLIQAMAGDGKGLWAVGDVRQAIYRFRGASPAGLLAFSADFPGAQRRPLSYNYRSAPDLVGLFSDYAAQMGGVPPIVWQAQRPAASHPSVELVEAEDETAQMDGLADAIRKHRSDGVALHKQAILCHTNRQAGETAEELGRRGIPVQHLGPLWEREEIKEMLALLSLASEPSGAALVRAARLPFYAVPLEDIRRLLHAARTERRPFPAALSLIDQLEDLTPPGKQALRQLQADLQPLRYARDAWDFFARFLFENGRYLRPLLNDKSAGSAQKRLALAQLLLVAQVQSRRLPLEEGETARAAFLAYLRRLLSTGQERTLRNPFGAQSLEAVRLMTIHQAKGLEFSVVYLPNLSQGLFPPRKGSSQAATPPGLSEEATEEEGEAEQEALFFVALSRARDRLVLSRPTSVDGKPVETCRSLQSLQPLLDRLEVRPTQWDRETTAATDASQETAFRNEGAASSALTDIERLSESETGRVRSVPEADGALTLKGDGEEGEEAKAPSASALEQYMKCPRLYYYSRVLHLEEPDDEPTYLRFHQALFQTLASTHTEAAEPISLDEMLDRFETEWEQRGPREENAHVRVLKERAPRLLQHALRLTEEERPGPGYEMAAQLEAGTVRVPCDRADALPEGGLRLVDVSLKRPRGTEHREPRLALMRLAAEQNHPDRTIQVAIDNLQTGERLTVKPDRRREPDRVKKYNEALKGVQSEQFAPKPEARKCADCPFFLICPS